MSADRRHRRRPAGDLPAPGGPNNALAGESELLDELRPDPRRERARGARPPLPALRAQPRDALQRRRRAERGPDPGRQPRPRLGARALRPRARGPVRRLRGADDPRRAAPPLSRPRLDAARAARPPGEHPLGRGRDHEAQPRARALADGSRDRRAARDRRGRRAGGVRGGRREADDLARPALGRLGARRRRADGGADRRRRSRLRAGRGPRGARRHAQASSTRPSARSCGCASPRT